MEGGNGWHGNLATRRLSQLLMSPGIAQARWNRRRTRKVPVLENVGELLGDLSTRVEPCIWRCADCSQCGCVVQADCIMCSKEECWAS